mmetsp:Transcript_4306/g.9546  ORF Transcript_4306/g.9546 Transcript_4306/m.9546 type:complete len:280 (+) Transcript_4306:166-1005(+)
MAGRTIGNPSSFIASNVHVPHHARRGHGHSDRAHTASPRGAKPVPDLQLGAHAAPGARGAGRPRLATAVEVYQTLSPHGRVGSRSPQQRRSFKRSQRSLVVPLRRKRLLVWAARAGLPGGKHADELAEGGEGPDDEGDEDEEQGEGEGDPGEDGDDDALEDAEGPVGWGEALLPLDDADDGVVDELGAAIRLEEPLLDADLVVASGRFHFVEEVPVLETVEIFAKGWPLDWLYLGDVVPFLAVGSDDLAEHPRLFAHKKLVDAPRPIENAFGSNDEMRG